jgi:hypothetical protein
MIMVSLSQGDIQPTRGGGTSVTFTGIETHRHSKPVTPVTPKVTRRSNRSVSTFFVHYLWQKITIILRDPGVRVFNIVFQVAPIQFLLETEALHNR